MNKVTDFSKHLSSFLNNYLINIKNSSQNTIVSYCDTFRLLLMFMRDEKNISIEKIALKNITHDLITDFLNWLEDERQCCISTRNQRLAAIHSFFRYVQIEQPGNILSFQKILSIPYKKSVKSSIQYLNVNTMKSILSQPDIKSISGRRDLVLLSVLYDTGCRVSEISNLKVVDVRLDSPAKVSICGKGRKIREVPILNNTVALLKQYLVEQNLNQSHKLNHPLFFNRQGNKLSRAGIAYIVNKYADMTANNTSIPLSNISPHIFRHSKAMHLLQADVNIIYIRDFLGHEDINTTQIYARADYVMKKKALEKASLDTNLHLPPWATDSDLLDWLKNFAK